MALKLTKIDVHSERDGLLMVVKFREESFQKVGEVVKYKTDIEKSVEVTLRGGPLEVAQALSIAVDQIVNIGKP